MFWFTILKDLIKILREGQSPAKIAGGFALGSILGLSPMLTLQGVLVWFVLLVLDVNIAAALLSITFCSLFAYMLDPFFHWFGYTLLVQENLRELWTWMYNVPIAPLTRFNNTVVLGSLVSSIMLFIPIYFGMKRAVVAYRIHFGSKIEKWKIYQALKKNAIVQMYMRIRDLGS
ncbi:MAG TPA: TIGR03546 family protein [Bacteroidota bacterium]|jgi:uncharacterized protein (TIGR03546 family)